MCSKCKKTFDNANECLQHEKMHVVFDRYDIADEILEEMYEWGVNDIMPKRVVMPAYLQNGEHMYGVYILDGIVSKHETESILELANKRQKEYEEYLVKLANSKKETRDDT